MLNINNRNNRIFLHLLVVQLVFTAVSVGFYLLWSLVKLVFKLVTETFTLRQPAMTEEERQALLRDEAAREAAVLMLGIFDMTRFEEAKARERAAWQARDIDFNDIL